MDDIKISIIMPVYNAAKYLPETLDSVANQSFCDYELIAVNDGSTDESSDILEAYKNRIKNIRIINQNNSGVSASRNNGINVARGQYVSFLDADDVLNKDFLELLYAAANQADADIVFCEYYSFYDGARRKDAPISTQKDFQNFGALYGNSAFEHAMKIGCGTSCWNKLYRREILKKYQINFDMKSSFGEDMFFNWKVFLIADNIIYIPQKLYGYRQNESSATAKYHSHLYESYMREFGALRCFAEQNNIDLYKLDKAIELNLAQRIKSFLRMDVRKQGTLFEKYKNVRITVDKENLQQAAKAYLCESGENSDSNLYRWIVSKSHAKVFLHSLYCEMRLQLAKRIKNKH